MYVNDVESAVLQMRESGFNDIFDASVKVAEAADVEMRMPRVTGRQLHRHNMPVASVEEHFRLSVFLPFLDYLISQLNEWFKRHRHTWKMPSSLLPQDIPEAATLPIAEEFATLYSNVISASELQGELAVWAAKWKSEKRETHKMAEMQAVANCPEVFFPNMHRPLKILATLPMSTAEADRSFSSQRHLKTYLRASTTNERLVAIAFLNIPVKFKSAQKTFSLFSTWNVDGFS
ncbi:hypothetical protein HPB49_009944 [Dermacentor silvarum]|uniref:Uncharacterized protein n=1 Tax=Dermacentor silvarum TaxID=543639 RepID=A0ACB8DZ08_DERSI|nr:hypothetical protein HPB49_009944 [Dermacentor silvarum]